MRRLTKCDTNVSEKSLLKQLFFPQNADADSAEQVPEPADRGKFPPSRGRHAQQNRQGRGEPGEATEISHHPPTLVSTKPLSPPTYPGQCSTSLITHIP